MKSISQILTLFFLLNFCYTTAQNVFVLEKANKRKSFKFKAGDRIKVYAEPDSIYFSGRIALITDTSLIFEETGYEVHINNIRKAYTPRWGFGFLSELFLKAGIGYAIVAGANQVISGNQPDLLKYPIVVGGSLIASSFLIKPLAIRKHKIHDHSWRVIILDFTNSSNYFPE